MVINDSVISIHLVSDYTGQTVKAVSRAVKHRFKGKRFKEYGWVMINSIEALNKIKEEIKKTRGIVIYTISDKKLRNELKEFCFKINIACISAISHVTRKFAAYIGDTMQEWEDYSSKFDEDYFDKVEAIEFSLKHDDGQNEETIKDADILILGPSRTSKTPTSVYLAYSGYKTANIPYIRGVGIKKEFLDKKIFTVGLIIEPSRLVQIRNNRAKYLNISNIDYTDIENVKQEYIEAKRQFLDNKIPIIDVSKLSIEEVSASIISMYLRSKI